MQVNEFPSVVTSAGPTSMSMAHRHFIKLDCYDSPSHMFFSPSTNSLNHFLERILILECCWVWLRAIPCVCTYSAYRGGPSTQGEQLFSPALVYILNSAVQVSLADFGERSAWAALVFP